MSNFHLFYSPIYDYSEEPIIQDSPRSPPFEDPRQPRDVRREEKGEFVGCHSVMVSRAGSCIPLDINGQRRAARVIPSALIGNGYELSDVISDGIFWHRSEAICQQLKCSFDKPQTSPLVEGRGGRHCIAVISRAPH